METMKTVNYHHYKHLLDLFVLRAQSAMGGNLISIILYGSVARGEAKPTSDIDLLAILKNASSIYWERLQPILPLLRALRREPSWLEMEAKGFCPSFSVIVLSKEEALENQYLYLDMIEDAKILVDQEGFFQKRLDALKGRLQELGARKVKQHDMWYWDLKPNLTPGEVVTL
jgi:hypothetical protein